MSLFGSYARGEANSNSDLDFLLEDADEIILQEGKLFEKISVDKIFEFENIRDALIAQNFGKMNGKIVVKVC